MPKTAKGKRTIAIGPPVVETLRTLWRTQLEERLAWGPAWSDTGLVFTKEDGTGLHPQYITWAFQRATKRAGLPVLPLHALRHRGLLAHDVEAPGSQLRGDHRRCLQPCGRGARPRCSRQDGRPALRLGERQVTPF